MRDRAWYGAMAALASVNAALIFLGGPVSRLGAGLAFSALALHNIVKLGPDGES